MHDEYFFFPVQVYKHAIVKANEYNLRISSSTKGKEI